MESGETPASRTTIQHIIPYDKVELFPITQRDVLADWSGGDAPLNLLLDYVYAIAAIKRWAAPDIQNMLKSRHETDYNTKISPSLKSNTDAESDGPTDSGSEYELSKSHTMDSERSRDMDFAFQFSMFFRGYPPGTTWQMLRQQQEEEAEVRSRQIAQEKVHRWLKPGGSLSLSWAGRRWTDILLFALVQVMTPVNSVGSRCFVFFGRWLPPVCPY